MRIAINGTGVAGPTLAYWLRHYGHEPVLFEKAPKLRTGGYVVDFWGVGYDIAEKMGLLPRLHELGYSMEELRMVDADGEPNARMKGDTFRALTDGRYVSIARGDLAATIFDACDGIEARFGRSIVGLRQHDAGVRAAIDDGTHEDFDLVVGADGLHSHVRELTFGPESDFEHFLGFQVAVFIAPGYPRRDELVFVSHTIPGRHLARISLHGDETAFLFIWRSERNPEGGAFPETDDDKRRLLRHVFADMGWEAPDALALLDGAENIYLDRVSQIRMDHWTKGRVALVGDAAACASLLAGEGSGLGMTEAYVLAGELAAGDHERAFAAYEQRMQPFVVGKQQAAMRFAGFFAPATKRAIWMRDLGVRMASVPWLARMLMGSSLRDEIELPTYDTPEPKAGEGAHPAPTLWA